MEEEVVSAINDQYVTVVFVAEIKENLRIELMQSDKPSERIEDRLAERLERCAAARDTGTPNT